MNKSFSSIFAAATLLLVATVVTAQPPGAPRDDDKERMMRDRQGGHGGDGMMGQGMMGGGMMGQGMMDDDMMGMMGGMMHGSGPIGMLDLTDDQRAKINKIQDEQRKKNWDAMGKIMDEQSKLRDLYAADKRDPKIIGAVYGTIFNLKRQMIEATIDAQNRMEALLTDKQRQELKQSRRGTGGSRDAEGCVAGGMEMRGQLRGENRDAAVGSAAGRGGHPGSSARSTCPETNTSIAVRAIVCASSNRSF